MILVFKKGNIPHNLGKKHSKETRKKISKHHLKYYADATKNPMYGKHHNRLSKLRNRRSHLGKKASDKTKRKMSESRKGEKNAFFGKTHSEEMKQKLRLSLKKRLEENQKHINPKLLLKLKDKLKGLYPYIPNISKQKMLLDRDCF